MRVTGLGTLARFGAVAVVCLALDLSVAWLAAGRIGVPLPAAAALGFAAGAVLSYALHEFWTFRDGARTASRARMVRYGTVLAVVFLVRIGAVALLETLWPGPAAVLPILAASVGLSFSVNFLLSRRVVFVPARTGDGAARPRRGRAGWSGSRSDIDRAG